MSSGGEICRVPLYALAKMNTPKFDRVKDSANILLLKEASVMHNLCLKYGSKAIHRQDGNPPRIFFKVTESAWVAKDGGEHENQSILITLAILTFRLNKASSRTTQTQSSMAPTGG
ncbi:hypothetical protein DFJ58DRAFT_868251 [Suillus subalutaceus]|uniref:uncharacterized protein n=1 Tax=Suillus subalutaceus TaxID=48586 RepID=UPI001B873961|nr:uncharacterized protein DFJ58DRAFT_868251 [Suillus subalutaceus]KAG1835373.1 hypothetical protein DFJ58DRAFT_868251 [Suillus subalutaceus]